MNIKTNRIISLLLVFSMIITLCACGNKKAEKTSLKNKNVITDQAGRKVEIPEKVDSIAYSYGVATSFLLALKADDLIVAGNVGRGFYKKSFDSLKDVGTVGRGFVDMESLANYNPDLFIHKAADKETLEEVKDLGITTVGISPESMEDIINTLDILGKLTGKEKRAKELIEYYNKKIEQVKNIAKKIPKEERKTAILMGSELGRVAAGDMLQSKMIETAGGICSASKMKNDNYWLNCGVEKIFEWNPDYIFVTNSSSCEYTVDYLYKEKAWSGLKSVKNKKIMVVPSDQESWEFPGVSSLLGCMWMLLKLYPEYYSEQEFIKEVDEFYQFVYGKTFDRNFLGY